jgi:hypothetical protein
MNPSEMVVRRHPPQTPNPNPNLNPSQNPNLKPRVIWIPI